MDMAISIVCTGQIEDPETYLKFLSDLGLLPSVSEIVVPLTVEAIGDSEFNTSFFELADSPEAKIVPFVPEDRSTHPQTVNQAIARTTGNYVLVLESPVIIDGIDFEQVSENLIDNPREIIGFSHRVLNEDTDSLDEASYFRSIPSKGPHNYVAYAFTRRYFLELRGFDEDRALQGILGPDLIARHERRGGSVVKLGRKSGIVYSPASKPKFTNAVSLNEEQLKALIASKPSIYRNLIDWSVPSELRVPLISVAIATKDRESLVGESISSVLYQSFQDFEIVVVDDGSENSEEVAAAVHASQDPRITLLRNDESRGVSHARNRAADATECLLTAVHDDDDIMLPGRLEWGIEALNEKVDASYGSWTNFDHYDGKLRTFITRNDFDSALVVFSGEGPGHSTWTIPTDLIKTIRYNESLTSSVDHYFATRAAASGVKWGHIRKVAYLRRVHDFQLTSQDTARQKSGHTLSKFGNTFLASDSGLTEMREEGKKHTYPAVIGAKVPSVEFTGYLPDHLVRRDVVIDGNVSNALSKIGLPTKMVSLMEDRDLETGVCYVEQGLLKDVTFAELVRLRKSGITRWKAVGSLRPVQKESEGMPLPAEPISIEDDELAIAREKVFEQASSRLNSILGMLRRDFKNGHLVVVDHRQEVPDLQVPQQLQSAKLQRRLLVRGELGVQICYTVYGFENLAAAIETVERLSSDETPISSSMYPGAKVDELLEVLSQARQHEILSNSVSDSGLGS